MGSKVVSGKHVYNVDVGEIIVFNFILLLCTMFRDHVTYLLSNYDI